MRSTDSPLTTVIRVKGHLVKKAQRELAVLRVTREKEEGTLESLEGRQSSAIHEAARKKRGRAVELQTGRAFIQTLSRKIERQEARVREASTREDGKRGELVGHSQSKQMITDIDTRRKVESAKAKERRDQRDTDAIAQRLRSEF